MSSIFFFFFTAYTIFYIIHTALFIVQLTIKNDRLFRFCYMALYALNNDFSGFVAILAWFLFVTKLWQILNLFSYLRPVFAYCKQLQKVWYNLVCVFGVFLASQPFLTSVYKIQSAAEHMLKLACQALLQKLINYRVYCVLSRK